ncbi:class I SAM-dependent methyltransferase [Nocardioides daphniae]|uniref:Methyltransferase n=1 Tax=Nocardioides daphniae TaxID=402297 RepID=A0A4P7UD28_9ACTN|nr:class I SAM-dependent methyltransferase [Nocardioides daphniae]QCC77966.1 class I SAM-dependent methyltransferase [Nocardioides daphniae]GGD23507.1 methyltransferase [Nocardioides daphniae]
MDLDTFTWLLTPDGQRLLERAAHLYADHEGDPLGSAAAVRKVEPDPERAAAALTQVQLRVKGVAKFGEDALQMYFTPDGLEQATRSRVAAHRAARLAAARPSSVVDLGCGIGGDLIAFARAGLTAAGVDLDPVRARVAQANLDALGLPGATMVADSTALDLDGFGAAFADPARRGARGRVFDETGWTPPWSFVQELLRRTSVVKVAPGIGHDLVPEGVEAEWVSDHGEVKEAALWSPSLATVRRRATVISGDGLVSMTDEDDPYQGEERPVVELAQHLYEPDGAVIRAGLVTAVAAGVGGGLLDAHIAYVTSEKSFRSPFMKSYYVIEELPYREKQLKAALVERNVGPLTIKKRGVDVVPEQLRKRLALTGDVEATIVLTRIGGVGRVLHVRPF